MTEEQASNDPIPLMPDKRVHVVRDSPLTGAARELEARRDIWLSALHGCVQTLRIASRSREWAMQAGNIWNRADQTFPTPIEGFRISESMAQMAVITFFTVFKSGREDDGLVAGNGREAVKRFREACLEHAFSEPAERAIFDALYKRLEQARDGLLAHDDGSAQGMEHYGNISSFRPQDAGVAPEDVGRLLICAERLLTAVKSMCALPPPC